MKKRFIVLILFLIILFGGGYLWWTQARSPLDKNSSEYNTFVVEKGEDARSIAKKLHSQGFIRDPIAFFILARFGGYQDKIQAGDFRISPSMNLSSIMETLTHGTLDIWITIPEGWRNEEIALLLAKELNIPESEFLKEASEGYMFPDTYLVPRDASASSIVSILNKTFQEKITAEIMQKAKNKGLTLDELLIVASMVEREARLDEDRPIVASVIINRLDEGMKLDIDATVQYVLGYDPSEKNWWKKNLTVEDLKIDSPYNTYTNSGLPPAPIANPGLEAILAVVNAPDTDYLYYVSDEKGKIHPAKTVEEHNANVKRYIK
ncbi:endolytic transglycosylase MltG [Candidatus Gottesmanbacteria bacterium]|nr:endolytic transglycosylase MltG [Candidatus Gottesmanbacteria bacterium]